METNDYYIKNEIERIDLYVERNRVIDLPNCDWCVEWVMMFSPIENRCYTADYQQWVTAKENRTTQPQTLVVTEFKDCFIAPNIHKRVNNKL